MPPRSFLSLLSPAFQRRIAVRRRLAPPAFRVFTTSLTSYAAPKYNGPKPAPRTAPPDAALSALLSRLSLPTSPDLQQALLSCLTHPTYLTQPTSEEPSGSSSSTSATETNELLSSVGNSLLGLFASEHLAHTYPLLPTESLKLAVTAYVGPKACFSIARELGVGVHGGGNAGVVGGGKGMASAGITVRWKRLGEGDDGAEGVPIGDRFQPLIRRDEREVELGLHKRWLKRETYEDVVAGVVKAFIGLIYQEQGIHAARQFTHAFFLSRHLDLASLFDFKNPKHILSSVVARHLADAGVPVTAGMGRVETRLLASTGAHTTTPLYNIALFLPSGLKLSEGHGSSLKMAEHRASTNALLSLFLVRGDQGQRIGKISLPKLEVGGYGEGLPSSVHPDYPIGLEGLISEGEGDYVGGGSGVGVAGRDGLVESSRRRAFGGREGGRGRIKVGGEDEQVEEVV